MQSVRRALVDLHVRVRLALAYWAEPLAQFVALAVLFAVVWLAAVAGVVAALLLVSYAVSGR